MARTAEALVRRFIRVCSSVVLGVYLAALPASADEHGWETMERSRLNGLIRQGYEVMAVTAVGNRLITTFYLPVRDSGTETDAFGNPARLRAESVRCFEVDDGDGRYRLESCERAQ